MNKNNYYKLKEKKAISIPNYTLGEELINSISHGIGAILSIVALVLMVLKAHGAFYEVCVCLFGASMILLYTMSCVYHALSSKIKGKKVLRVLDHCNVFLLVFGTYIPISLLGVGGNLGWILFGVVFGVTTLGITLSSINLEKYQVLEVICHLVNGWSILFGLSRLFVTMGKSGVFFLVLGGIMYTLGSILYGLGASKKYVHSIFHFFCLLGTFFHFWAIYMYLL